MNLAAMSRGAEGVGVERHGERVTLRSPAFVFTLDTSQNLRAVGWENRLSGHTLKLQGLYELEVDLDAAERRIGITGWKFHVTQNADGPPDQEAGFRAGAAKPECNDSTWETEMTPNTDAAPLTGYAWARRKLQLDAADRGKSISFTFGGFGLFDYRYLRVFVNGEAIGTRDGRHLRRGPMTVTLDPNSQAYQKLNFGGENTIALQLGEFQNRLPRLDAVDTERRYELSRFYWPPTFEQVIAIGGNRVTPAWRVTSVEDRTAGDTGKVIFSLTSDQPALAATVTYRWSSSEGVLHKFVRLRNVGDRPVRVLDVRLGCYAVDANLIDGEQGHPVFADGDFLFGVAHPAGWSTAEHGEVLMHHHPGATVAPGGNFDCFESVYGVSRADEISDAFKQHIRSRMRRTIRHHDHPYGFIDPFGGDDKTDQYATDERRLVPQVAAVQSFARETGCRFDAFSVDFWENPNGDRSAPDPVRFPNGFTPIADALRQTNTALGLWVDITGADQSIGKNPAIAPTLNCDPAFGTERKTMCLATEPMPTIDRDGFSKLLRDGVRLMKFDGYWAACRNNAHQHLPGIYATEAIDCAFIKTLRDLDEVSPDCFFELYGGYHSPWWTLHADTIFESGILMEAATPGPWPTLWARDGVTRVLDEATVFSRHDLPALGKDSLGVWLSDWRWNSQIGKERWPEAFVMDLMRGTLLAQPWCDLSRMSAQGRAQLAHFIALLRAAPGCFDRTRLIIGDPWKPEPYGWCGYDGKRAMIAINNGTWKDQRIAIQLGPAWGLPSGQKWDLYRHYPRPARLRENAESSIGEPKIALRPFEIVLIEAVPAGQAPTLGGKFADEQVPATFAELSRAVDVNVSDVDASGFRTLAVEIPPTAGGFVAITADATSRGLPLMRKDAGSHYVIEQNADAKWTPVLAQKLYYKTSWQAWRAALAASESPRTLSLRVKADAPTGTEVRYEAHFVPN